MNLQRIFLLLGLCLALVACSGNTKDNFYQQLRLEQKQLLVLPSSSLHRQIRFLNKDVQSTLVKQLKAKHYAVSVVSVEDFKAAKDLALESSGAIYEPSLKEFVPLYPQKYYPALLNALRPKYRFDIAVVPELVLRTAKVKDREIEWDGQQATITYPEQMELAQVRALSLKLDFFQADGLGLGQRYAGYLMPFDIIGNRIPEFELRTDLYQQFEALNSAVAIALGGAQQNKAAGANDDE